MASWSFLVLPILVSISTSWEIPVHCGGNEDCKADEFCLQSYCERCTPCEMLYNRQQPASIDGALCAKSGAQCGNCLPGYDYHNTTDDKISIECSLIQTDSTSFDWKWIAVFSWLSIISMYLVAKKCDCRICCRTGRPRSLQPLPVNEPDVNLDLTGDVNTSNSISNVQPARGIREHKSELLSISMNRLSGWVKNNLTPKVDSQSKVYDVE